MGKVIRPDGSLDPILDFKDDGGTPMWRARNIRPKKTTKKILLDALGWFIAALVFPPCAYIFMLWFAYQFDASPYVGFAVFIGLIALGVYTVKARRR